MIRLTVTGNLVFENLSHETKGFLQTLLRLPNPTYHQAVRANPRARFALSEWIKYYEEQKDSRFMAPRGIRERFEKYAAQEALEYRVTDQRVDVLARKNLAKCSSISLRDYQRGLAETVIQAPEGLIRMDTGAGKTIIGLDVAAKLGRRTLIITPKLDLLSNWRREVLSNFKDLTPGIIQGSICDVQDITIATMQSLRNRLNDHTIKGDEFGLVIVDEAHQTVSQVAREVFAKLKAKYRYGLTATNRRSDGQGDAINFIFGPTIIDVKMARETPKVEVIHSDIHIWVQEYAPMITEQCQNEERNKLLIDIITKECESKRRVILLTKRVEHYKLLESLIPEHLKAFALSSKDKKAYRDELLTGLKSGTQEFDILLGTFPLLSTGIDIPSLDTLIIAGDLKSDVLAEQSAGRILRLFKDKQEPKIIDVWDVNNPILKKQGKERQAFYAKEKWVVTHKEAGKDTGGLHNDSLHPVFQGLWS